MSGRSGDKWWTDDPTDSSDASAASDDFWATATTSSTHEASATAPPASQPSSQRSSAATPLFVWVSGRETGPFSRHDLQAMLDDHSIDHTTNVREPTGSWVSVMQIPGLVVPRVSAPAPGVAPAMQATAQTNNPLAIVALVLGALGMIGGITAFATYASSEFQRALSKVSNNHVPALVGVIVFCVLAIVLGNAAKVQIIASLGRQSGLAAISLARCFAIAGTVMAILSFAVVHGG